MTEPDVSLTDFALALESAAFVAMLWRGHCHSVGRASWFLLYFASAALASLCGGLVHGFFLDSGTLGHAVFWTATLLAIGINAFAAWAIGARLLLSQPVARWIITVALLLFVVYVGFVFLGADTFRVAIWVGLPAALFLLASLWHMHRSQRRAGALVAAAGIGVTLAAMLVQQIGLGLHPTYFNHNAAAHVVQAVALGLFFVGSRRLLGAESDPDRTSTGADRLSPTLSGG
jgi:hypothetical protein